MAMNAITAMPARGRRLAAEGLNAMRYAEADWRSRGACLSVDPELFFPLSSVGPAAGQLTQAKSVCTRCPVRAECLDFALATRQVHGVWGGTSEEERRAVLMFAEPPAQKTGRSGSSPAATRTPLPT
jgi:WhiB family transcriptional regulator, redox-sensing transcriptional regulator